MCTLKKILKVVAIIAAIAGAAAAVYCLVKKLKAKKAACDCGGDIESFVSCSCLDDEPILVDDQPAPAEDPAEDQTAE